jgi:rubrerythrin
MSDFEIESVEQLLAIALAAEHDAMARYSDISKHMRDSGNQELAEMFAQIAELEGDHAKEVEQIIQALGIKDLPEAPKISWQHPRVRDDRDRATSPGTSSPYLALAYAVNNEELAFRFYSYVAANTNDDEIRKFAEAFAKEELSHAAMFRERRRRAYHDQRLQVGGNTIAEPGQIQSLADLLAAAIQIEQGIHDLLVATTNIGIDVSDSVEKSSTLIRNLGQEMSDLLPDPGNTPDPAGDNDAKELTFTGEAGVRQAIAAAAEQAFMFYDTITDAAQNENIMLKAQQLSHFALDRIDSLGTLLNE